MRPVRLRHAWQEWSKGHVFTAMPAAQAQAMVEAGQAEYVTVDEAPAAERAGGYEDRAMRGARRVRR